MSALVAGSVGCGGSSSKPTTKDMAHSVDMNLSQDLSSACDQVPTFDNSEIAAFYDTSSADLPMGADSEQLLQGLRANDNDPSLVDFLVIFAFHVTGDPAFAVPLTDTFTTASNLETVDKAGFVLQYSSGVPCTTTTCNFMDAGVKNYSVQGGSITATKLDNKIGGTMAVSGTNLSFVEWDVTGNKAVAGGACLDIGSFDWSSVLKDSTPATDAGT